MYRLTPIVRLRICAIGASLTLAGLLAIACTPASAAPPPLSWRAPTTLAHQSLTSISCPTASLCVAVGGRSVFVTTRPAHDGVRWTRTGLPARGLSGVSCASISLCVAVDSAGDALTSTRPTGGASAWHVTSVDAGDALSGVSCPVTTFCVAVGDGGHAVTSRDPTGGAAAWRLAAVDPPVDCPSSSDGTISCTSVGSGPQLACSGGTNPPGPGNIGSCPVTLAAVSCPSPSFCAAVDNAGDAVTSADPAAGAAAWHVSAVEPLYDCTPHTWCVTGLTGVSCPTPRLCVAVDNVGNAATSTDPGSRTPWFVTGFGQSGPLAFGGVSCPLPSRCVAVDDGGNAATTVHPSVNSPWAAMQHIDDRAENGLRSVSCVSVVLCVAVDQGGAAVLGTLSRGRILASLSALLTTMRHSSLGKLYFHAPAPMRVTPPSPGRLTVHLDIAGAPGRTRRSTRLASSVMRFTDTAPRALQLTLTSAGRATLGHASSVHLIAHVAFTPSGSDGTTLSRTFTLHR